MSGFLEAARGADTPRAPIWIMRQAGRYLPEYRAIKARSSFEQMTRDPAIAAEITLQPLQRFELDAAIVFADIMTPLEALSIDVRFDPGPKIARPIRSAKDVETLHRTGVPAPFVGETLRIVRRALPREVALIGFGGAPLTLAAYVVEGGGSKDFEKFRAFLRAEPQTLHRLLDALTDLSIDYLQMQVDGGADAIQLFDSWAGLHDEATFREFGVPYATRIMRALESTGVVRTYFALGASHLSNAVAEIPSEITGVDWRTKLVDARRTLNRTLQGNLDPAYLFADSATLVREAQRVLDDGRGGAHVFNLGHGIWPETPLDAVKLLIETVRGYERA
ncbi:MAG TPA: uroporphyrinogen decarboxylase [Candidatus Tumulicola sp.]